MPHTTPSNHHAAKEQQAHCEASNTLKRGYCKNPATQRSMDGLLLVCEQHARQFDLEEQVACWEAILLHIELWSKTARKRGREDIVRLLDLERAEAVAALACRHEDLKQVENEDHQPKKREL